MLPRTNDILFRTECFKRMKKVFQGISEWKVGLFERFCLEIFEGFAILKRERLNLEFSVKGDNTFLIYKIKVINILKNYVFCKLVI